MRFDILERLNAHQADILAITRGGEAMLRDASKRDVAELARARWTLTRALGAYQLFKHREIFEPAIRGQLGGDPLLARRMKTACTALGDDFRAYVQKWSSLDTGGAWADYQPAALAMIGRIRSHIARERAEVGALLATPRPATVPPRPGPPRPAG